MPHMGSIARMIQSHPQVVGTCPDHHPQPIGQNRVFKFERPGPPPLSVLYLYKQVIGYVPILLYHTEVHDTVLNYTLSPK